MRTSDNQQQANSSTSLHHVEGAGRVFTCVALAAPDRWFDKLFTLMSFQHLPVASNIWLALPPEFHLSRTDFLKRMTALTSDMVSPHLTC